MVELDLEFIRLCDLAIRQAEVALARFSRPPDSEIWAEKVTTILNSLKLWREAAVLGELNYPSGGARLGLSRGISEWGLDDYCNEGAMLYKACWDLENYHQDSF